MYDDRSSFIDAMRTIEVRGCRFVLRSMYGYCIPTDELAVTDDAKLRKTARWSREKLSQRHAQYRSA
jgi:hypothetical protein